MHTFASWVRYHGPTWPHLQHADYVSFWADRDVFSERTHRHPKLCRMDRLAPTQVRTWYSQTSINFCTEWIDEARILELSYDY